jgi:taurine dioxygenase
MRLEPCSRSASIGVVVLGVDMAEPPSRALAQEVRDALFAHHVLVFRDQHLTPERQVRFAQALGAAGPPEQSRSLTSDFPGMPEIQRLSFIRPDGTAPDDLRPSQGDTWHTDYAYLPEPPELAFLCALELPADGPETWYLDMQAAYAALPESRRRALDGLRVVHTQKGPLSRDLYQLPPYLKPGEADDGSADRSTTHPLVRAHPVSGRKSLYMAECYTTGIEGYAPDEGRDLIAELYRHALDTGAIYRHVWRPGDCLIWDNRATNHRRSKPMDRPRVMHRVTIALSR